MSALPQKSIYTETEYLTIDAENDVRYEFSQGHIYAMTGASREHNVISSNVHIELGTQLRKKNCELYQADMRVQVKNSDAYRYPDLVAVCGEPHFVDTTPESLTNPTILIEVLSESTENKDRSEKLFEYQSIDSLEEYLLIAQDAPRIERFLRQDDGNWLYTRVEGTDKTLHLPSIDCTLDLSEVYRRVEFDKS